MGSVCEWRAKIKALDKKVFQAFMDVRPGSADGLIVNNALELFELAK